MITIVAVVFSLMYQPNIFLGSHFILGVYYYYMYNFYICFQKVYKGSKIKQQSI